MPNIYPTARKGYFIDNHRPGRWLGQRRYGNKRTKSACFYSFEEALAYVDSLPNTWEEIQLADAIAEGLVEPPQPPHAEFTPK